MITINTQEEFNALADDVKGEIRIIGILERINKTFKNAYINVYGNAQISYVYGNAQISNVSDNAQISNVSGNAQISNVYRNAQISNVYDNAQISNVYDNAQIRYVYRNAQIRYVSDNAQIRYVYDNAQIRNVYGNAQIRNVYGNAQIRNVYGNAQIRYVYGNAQISNVSDNAQIRYVYDNAQIRNVSDNAQISNVYGNASILFIDGNAKVNCKGKNIVSYYKDKTVELDLSKQTTIVVLDRFKATIESYLDTYPVEVKDGIAIMYKAVRKLESGKFVSDYDRSFEYKIGKKQKEECDLSTRESCKPGIHVSHKMWALKFGAGWDNMALLELEVDLDKVMVAEDCDGKIRTSEVKCIREVPESEYYL